MSDAADRAAAEFMPHEFAAQRNHAAAQQPHLQPGWSSFDGQHCVDCDEPLHPARLQLQSCRCVGCKIVLERRR